MGVERAKRERTKHNNKREGAEQCKAGWKGESKGKYNKKTVGACGREASVMVRAES